MNYSAIKYCDIANGTGVRTTLFVSGCRNHCEGCFQPQTWDFSFGKEFTVQTEDQIIEMLAPSYINGLSVLGGEPFEPSNQAALLPFLRRVKAQYPEKTVWAFTGFVYDRDLIAGGRKHTDFTDEMLSYVDILVDGPYVEELHDITLQFRGSANQRIIDMNLTRVRGQLTIWEKLRK